jgi:hypothetical protein
MSFRSGRLAVAGVGVVLLVAGISGCGGDDDSGPLTKEDFIAQANQVCSDFREESKLGEEAFTAAVQENDYQAAADAFQENADSMKASIDKVAALEGPEEDQDTLDEFIALSREQNDAAFAAADALREEDDAAVQEALNTGAQADKNADVIALEYGLTDCVGDTSEEEEA